MKAASAFGPRIRSPSTRSLPGTDRDRIGAATISASHSINCSQYQSASSGSCMSWRRTIRTVAPSASPAISAALSNSSGLPFALPHDSPSTFTSSPSKRETCIVFGEALPRRFRATYVLEPAELHLLVERSGVEAVQQRRHVVGEVLRTPYAPQRGLAVRVGRARVAVLQKGDECVAQNRHVVHRQVQSLRAGRRHDVRSIAGQEQ